MPWEAWITLAIVLLMAAALVRNAAGPDVVLLGGLTLLMTLGLLSDKFPTPAAAVADFGNEGLITIAVLFVVAQGLGLTGAMGLISQPLLGRPRTVLGAQMRLMVPVAAMSAFLNNTPIVAMFIPVVSDWCKKTGLSPSKLFIPLSYAAIMGGSCTLIGTATNLVVQGMIFDAQSKGHLLGVDIGMFTITAVGVPATIVGILYILLVSPKLLPDRGSSSIDLADARRYTVEMLVEPGSAIDGKSIEQAGLRQLPGAYLVEIDRQGDRLVAVGPEQVLSGGDRLIFVGIVESVRDLQKIRGLAPATDQVCKLSAPEPDRCLVEAVVSNTCPLVGMSIREGRFRTVYNAAVIAVYRAGEHLEQKIGDIVLRPGDTLLIQTHPRFVETQRNRRDFFLVSTVAGSQPVRHDRAWIALLIMAVMVFLASTNTLRLLNAALLAAGFMVMFRCCSAQEARNSVEWRVLLAIGAALGVGRVLDSTGAAMSVAQTLIDAVQWMGPRGVLVGIYLVAMLFNSMIGPVGSAALVFPIARAAATGLGVDFTPFAISLMMAASASFATPIAYQTNLMVFGVGGYRFSDYIRIGLPLNLLVMAVVVILAPQFWPFVTPPGGG